ncbi:MAG: hypothetical protein E7552_06385 [Ruminococcaceae bacterium]|nr:hypothetical protein [Oscillospiraceae bacterium]
MNTGEEKAVAALRALYRRYGYRHYKMSKFEEYDLYSRNKEFLISDNVITFTDTNGKLMALKPDVTLSIIKNGQDTDGMQKVYYDEHVYRVAEGTRAFKELKQVGLECVGTVDTYAVYEVLMLAAGSLAALNEEWVLDISHLNVVFALLEDAGLSAEDTRRALALIGEKNRHELTALCTAAAIPSEKAAVLLELVGLYGTPASVLPRLHALLQDTAAAPFVSELQTVSDALARVGFGDKIHIDFSVVNDGNYYNGFVFKGFIHGISSAVLSGGQYDRLMQKMGRRAGAIGFALYLDLLAELPTSAARYDADAVLLYDGGAALAAVQKAVTTLTAEGREVLALSTLPAGLRYQTLYQLNGEEVTVVG